MADLVTALGLVLVIEGIIYGAFPQIGRRVGEFLRTASDDMLRMAGLISAAIGLGVVWLARSLMQIHHHLLCWRAPFAGRGGLHRPNPALFAAHVKRD